MLLNRRQCLLAPFGFLLADAVVAGASDELAVRDAATAERFRAKRRFARTRFGKIAYVEQGAGAVALFLHGFPLNGFHWRGALDRLSLQRRCIALDFLGLGFTEVAARQSVAPAAQADMIAAFLDRLSIRTVDLVANDSGGSIAQLFLVRHPGRVRTLLLTNCDVEPDSPPATLQQVIKMAGAGTLPDEFLAPLLNDKAMTRATGLGGHCYSDPAQPTDAAIDYYLAPLLSSTKRKALANAYVLGLTPNPLAGIEAELRRCAVPTRVVWGMADTIFSTDNPAYLERVLPQFRGVRRVDNGRLFFPEEYPDVIAEEARGLWSAAP